VATSASRGFRACRRFLGPRRQVEVKERVADRNAGDQEREEDEPKTLIQDNEKLAKISTKPSTAAAITLSSQRTPATGTVCDQRPLTSRELPRPSCSARRPMPPGVRSFVGDLHPPHSPSWMSLN
jgi:hypothetical protein